MFQKFSEEFKDCIFLKIDVDETACVRVLGQILFFNKC